MTRIRTFTLLGALAAAVVMADAAPSAHAHGVLPGQRVVVDAVDPALGEVEVWGSTLVGQQLVVRNDGTEPIMVLDADGAPFLRIGPDGVDGNRASPAWYLANAAVHTAGAVPPGLDGTGPADWLHVSDDPQWAWYDGRVHNTATGSQLAAADDDLRLAAWTVPLRAGTRDALVRGHGEYRPGEQIPSSSLDAPPDVDGLELRAVEGSLPGLQAVWSGTGTITILGAEGEPFAQLGPDGASVNEASPTWLLTMGTRAEAPTGVVDGDAEPRWKIVDTRARLGWLDARLLLGTRDDGEGAAGERRWTIPIETADGVVEFEGRTVLVDSALGGESGSRWWLWLGLGAVAAVLATGITVTLRSRRARP